MYGLSSDFQNRDVAIYARVSTEHEAQLSALENQIDWYKPILEARPNWTLTAQYIDEGITGTSAEKRPHFMQMIKDAKDKKFNMIITREVSRFARNTVDTLQYTRLLKEYGVEVFFISNSGSPRLSHCSLGSRTLRNFNLLSNRNLIWVRDVIVSCKLLVCSAILRSNARQSIPTFDNIDFISCNRSLSCLNCRYSRSIYPAIYTANKRTCMV